MNIFQMPIHILERLFWWCEETDMIFDEFPLHIEDGDPGETDLHKALFQRKINYLSRGLPDKPRLLIGALKKAITEQFDGRWQTHITYLYKLIKHIEILNTGYPELLIPFIHACIHLSVLNNDALVKFVLSWEILLGEALECPNRINICSKRKQRFGKEIRDYLRSFVRIVTGNRNKEISQGILINQLVERTLHRLYNMQDRIKTIGLPEDIPLDDVVEAINGSQFSSLGKNSLLRICQLMLRTGCRERSNRIKDSILKLISMKSCSHVGENENEQSKLGSVDYYIRDERSVLIEIEKMLMSLIHEEDYEDTAANE